MAGRLLRWYGAGPLHMLALVASFALVGYAVPRLLSSDAVAVAIWLVGAAVLHDLLLLPLYTLADRSAQAVLRHRTPLRAPGPAVNFIRVPALISGLLLLVWFPLIVRLPSDFEVITGFTTSPYLGRWLLVTGLVFAGSALAYAVSLRRHRQRDGTVSSTAEH